MHLGLALPKFVSLFVLAIPTAAIQCKDESGKDVDYWFAYKYPVIASETYDGVMYSYLTSDDPSSFTQSKYAVTDSRSIMAVTLADIYSAGTGSKKGEFRHVSNNSSRSGSSSLGYMFYNDQWPDGEWTEDYGHSKGALAFDENEGFFLQHSVPDFPQWVDEGYEYGSSQEMYGQQLTCFTMSLDQLNAVAAGMKYSGPWVYDYAPLSSSSSANASLASVSAVVNGSTRSEYWENASWSAVATTLGGLELTVFAKTGGFGQDMIDQIVSPALGVPLISQSWLNSGNPLGSYCPNDGSYVVDTKTLAYGEGTEDWSTSYDHSKWVVSASSSSKWVCIVDNNRCQSQYTRGGLATCLKDVTGWYDALKTGVVAEGDCSEGDDDLECCYYDEASCSSGDVCCLSGCQDPKTCSYSQQGCSGEYGEVHSCTWDDGMCVVS